MKNQEALKENIANNNKGVVKDEGHEDKRSGDMQNHEQTTGESIKRNLSEVDFLKAKVAELEDKCAQLQDQHLRARADLDNARKRFQKDKEDIRSMTTQIVLSEIMNVFDAFKLGVENAKKHQVAPDILSGFQIILQQFENSLKNLGVQSIDPTNAAFDPNFHEALSMSPHESIPEGHVIQTIRNGYRLGNKLLRPASVLVSQGKGPDKVVASAQVSEKNTVDASKVKA